MFVDFDLIQWLTMLLGVGMSLLMAWFAFVSWGEGERLARNRAFILAIVVPVPYLIAVMVGGTAASLILFTLTIFLGIILILPIGNRFPEEDDTPHKRIDERDIMFARAHLPVDSDRYHEYYARHPEKKALDDKFRRRPGLMSPAALYYDPVTTAAAVPALQQ